MAVEKQSMELRWQEADVGQDWLAQAVQYVEASARLALARHDRFDLVLAGGTTPERLYRALAERRQDWGRWHCWLGDERCLPPDHPERNSTLVTRTLLGAGLLPGTNFHPIPAELGPAKAAEAYAKHLSTLGVFDLVLLGLGEDGHTASLFPGQAWGDAEGSADVLAVYDAPKPPRERVSLSARRLGRARQVLFLVTGAGKRDAVSAWRRGAVIPAASVRPVAGVDVIIDRDAVPLGE